MAWRWNVSIAAERRADSSAWALVLSFRTTGPERQGFWIPYPVEASSRAMVLAQAEKIPDDSLTALLAERSGRAEIP